MTPKSNILFPCYIYPSPGAWDPLHQAIADYPNVNFTVVVNPFNGPGLDAVPDLCYQREILVLKKYDNVHVIGYIHTSYASRDIAIVGKEIETYSKWAENSSIPGLTVEGLFVDEVPWHYDEKVASYLQDIMKLVNKSRGFGSRSKIVLNPGCVPNSKPGASTFADSTVVFEDTYNTFKLRHANHTFEAIRASRDRSALACLVHSIPTTLADEEYRTLVRQVRELAGEVFLTDQSQGYYSSFSTGWEQFVEVMAG